MISLWKYPGVTWSRKGRRTGLLERFIWLWLQAKENCFAAGLKWTSHDRMPRKQSALVVQQQHPRLWRLRLQRHRPRVRRMWAAPAPPRDDKLDDTRLD